MKDRIEIDPAKPQAFLSYTRADDNFLGGAISRLRKDIEAAVPFVSGQSFKIFQDKDGIGFGQDWLDRLEEALRQARFLIPILSPSYFRSEPCRAEAFRFLEYEAAANRNDLILPIYLQDTPLVDNAAQRASDDLAVRLAERQFRDWRQLIHATPDNAERRAATIALAREISEAASRNVKRPASPLPEPSLPKEVMDRIAALEDKLGERGQAIAAEQSRREQAESELSREKAKTRKLAEAPSVFQGQVEEAKKREVALRKEIASLNAQIAEHDDSSVKQRLAEAEAALEEERGKREIIKTRLSSGVSRSLYLGTAALTLLVGAAAGGWWAAQESDNKVAELSQQVEALSAELANSKDALAAAKSAGEEEALEPLSTFKDCADCPEMVVIPAGSLVMGSPEDQKGRPSSEGPQHEVTIGVPFALGKYEVTRGEFSRFVSATGHEAKWCSYYNGSEWKSDPDRDWRDPGFEQTDAHPVTCVNWEDAQAYTDWLSKDTGETYRLPSEAEWEYAARAGTTTRYFWGDEIGPACAFANGYDATSRTQMDFDLAAFPCDDGFAQTAPAGSFRANALGLQDVSGNVWEWVEDSWQDNYDGAPTDGSIWNVRNNSERVLRGGSWFSYPDRLRSAFRLGFDPDFRNFNVGFRVSRTLTP